MARHQIIIVGRRMDTAVVGMREFCPDHVYLLYTQRTKNVYDPIRDLKPDDVCAEEYEVDAYSSDEVHSLCRSIRARIAEGDVLQYNITEGTKVEAFAALDIAKEFGDEAVYYTQEGETICMNDYSRRPTTARIRNMEFVLLFGNRLNSYNSAADLMPVDVVTAWEVKNFIEKFQKTFQRIQKQFRSEFGGRIEKLPEHFQVEREHNMFVDTSEGKLKITDRGRQIFDSRNNNATRLFFTGRWWEIIVSGIVTKWDIARHADPSDSEVWRNVEFFGDDMRKTKNELDIMVNDRRRLIVIECKSGYIAQENIYKIDAVRTTYGGDLSKGILVSYYPLDPDLARKCRDLHVYYFAPETSNGRLTYIKQLPAWLDEVVKEFE